MSLRMPAFHGAMSERLEAPVFVAPLVLEETGALPRVERAASRGERAASQAAMAMWMRSRRSRRRRRRGCRARR